jgi:hypothetical protein
MKTSLRTKILKQLNTMLMIKHSTSCMLKSLDAYINYKGQLYEVRTTIQADGLKHVSITNLSTLSEEK